MARKTTDKELLKRINELEKDSFELKRMEEALLKSERFLKSVFDAIQDGISVLDKDLNIVRVNRWVEMRFADKMPLVGKKCYNAYLKRQSPCPWCPCIMSMETSKVHTEIIPYPSAEKPTQWIELSAFPLKDDLGFEFGVIEYIKDITKYKLTEQKLRESEERYHNLFEESRDAIYITSREGEVIDVNQATIELFGYPREELIGKLNIRELYLHPNDRDKFQQEIERKGSLRNYEVQFRKKNGTEMDCLLTSTVRRSTGDKVLGYQGIIRDVTEFNRAVKALRESEARYRAIVEDQTELICRFLPNRRITFVNGAFCRYFGEKYEELIGHSFKPLVPEEDQAMAEKLFSSLSAKNPVTTYEHRVILPNSEIRWLLWTNRMVLDEHDNLIEFQSVGRDITARKAMEEALKKSSEKIKLFAYSVSHDLKNPALGLYGLTKILKKRSWDILDEEGKHFCDQILQTSEQIAALVETINVYMSTNESPLTVESVKLKEILKMVREEFSPQLNIRQIKWEEPEDLPEIKADRISLLRVLRNFVDNALKYGGNDLREIKIGYEESGGYHTLSVKDDGVGIKKEASEKIFGLFKRYETSKGIEGTGLGLSIVKEIAEQHKGKVWMEPGPKRGTTFFFSISRDL